MPPHEGDDPGPPDVDGLPVRHAVLPPGGIVTGCVIAAAAALLAHLRSLSAGLVWDDRWFLADDARVRSLASVWRSFGEAFFTPEHPTEMYRPLVNASLAIDWFLSRSAPGDVNVVWFHAVNLLLHAANAALVYLLFANLTKRKLGAPLLAAVLFAVHPLAVEPTTWIVGRCDLLAALCGLSSAVLLLRSPGRDARMWAAAALWGLGLFAKASIATLPVIVALGLVAYHQVEPRRFLSWRLGKRFAVFAVPAVVWLVARAAALGAAFPQSTGRVWREGSVGLIDAVQGVARGVFVQTAHVFVPVGLSGDYSGDVAWRPETAPWDLSSWLGVAILAGCVAVGLRLLRRHPAGFPLLAFAVALVPVLQVVPIGAIFADRFLYLPMAFLLLLAAEGLEHLYYRWGPLLGLAPTLALFVLLGTMSHLRAPVWRDDAAFHADVLRSYGDSADAHYRFAHALAESGRRDEAKAHLRARIAAVEKPDDELALLGAILLEDGELFDAEAALRRALDVSTKKRLHVRVLYNLAVCVKRQNRAAEAVPLLEKALRLDPDFAPASTLLTSLRSPHPGQGSVVK